MPNPFAHIELTTDNLKAAAKFYGKVFAWKLTDMPGMSYTMIDVAGGTGGGMQAKPSESAPTGWMPYVQVDDVKTTIAKAAKAGATVMLPFQEIGGGMGAIGVFADPNGAMLGVWEEAKQASLPFTAEPVSTSTVAKKAPSAPAKKVVSAPAKKAPKKSAAPVVSAPAKKAPKKSAAPVVSAPAKKAPKKSAAPVAAVAKKAAKKAPAPKKAPKKKKG